MSYERTGRVPFVPSFAPLTLTLSSPSPTITGPVPSEPIVNPDYVVGAANALRDAPPRTPPKRSLMATLFGSGGLESVGPVLMLGLGVVGYGVYRVLKKK